jgi:hypothetical protein
MKKTIMRLSSILLAVAFLLIAFGSGDSESEEFTWKKNDSKSFCGKKFKSSKTIEAIGMNVDVETVFNCDGTYTSKQVWDTDKANEEAYRNTAGSTSGEFANFSGTWEIVDKDLPQVEKNYMASSGFKDEDVTVIRYHSNRGKTRYAYIAWDSSKKNASPLYCSQITYPSDIDPVERYYNEEDLDLFSGFAD